MAPKKRYTKAERCKFIQEARAKGWTPAQIAAHLGVTVRTVYNWIEECAPQRTAILFSDVKLEELMAREGVSWKELYKTFKTRVQSGRARFSSKSQFSSFSNGTGDERPQDAYVEEIVECMRELRPGRQISADDVSGLVEWELFVPFCRKCSLQAPCPECVARRQALEDLFLASFENEDEVDDVEGMAVILATNRTRESRVLSALVVGSVGRRPIAATLIEQARNKPVALVGYTAIHKQYPDNQIRRSLGEAKTLFAAFVNDLGGEPTRGFAGEVERINFPLLEGYRKAHSTCARGKLVNPEWGCIPCNVCDTEGPLGTFDYEWVGKVHTVHSAELTDEIRRLKRWKLFVSLKMALTIISDAKGGLYTWRQPCLPTHDGVIADPQEEVDLWLGVHLVDPEDTTITGEVIVDSVLEAYKYAYAPALSKEEQIAHQEYIDQFPRTALAGCEPQIFPPPHHEFVCDVKRDLAYVRSVAGEAAIRALRI